jgi:hypothetical protein
VSALLQAAHFLRPTPPTPSSSLRDESSRSLSDSSLSLWRFCAEGRGKVTQRKGLQRPWTDCMGLGECGPHPRSASALSAAASLVSLAPLDAPPDVPVEYECLLLSPVSLMLAAPVPQGGGQHRCMGSRDLAAEGRVGCSTPASSRVREKAARPAVL